MVVCSMCQCAGVYCISGHVHKPEWLSRKELCETPSILELSATVVEAVATEFDYASLEKELQHLCALSLQHYILLESLVSHNNLEPFIEFLRQLNQLILSEEDDPAPACTLLHA